MKNRSETLSGWVHGGLWVWGDTRHDGHHASVSVQPECGYWDLLMNELGGEACIAKFPEEGLTNWEFAW
jgi:hypothetical protein